MVRTTLLAASLALAGCSFAPPSGRFACSVEDPTCPPGQRCVDGLCVAPDTQGAPDGGAGDALDADRPDADRLDADRLDADAEPRGTGDAQVDAMEAGPDASSADPCDGFVCGSGRCASTGGTPACVCPPTFTGAHCDLCEEGFEGAACAFVPVVRDPDLEDSSAWASGSAWGADGRVVFGRPEVCSSGRVTQEVTFPPRLPVPLVLETEYRGVGEMRMAAVVGDQEVSLERTPTAGAFRAVVCLDASLAGQTLPVGIGMGEGGCPGTTEVTRIDIRPAEMGECPAHDFVPNPDFDSDEGWIALGNAGTAASVEVSSGNPAARLVANAHRRASLSGSLYVPTASVVAHPGMRLWVDGADTLLHAELDGWTLGTADVEENRLVTFCLPPWLAGRWAPIVFEAQGAESTEPGQVDLDKIQVVEEPACELADGVVGGGFEPVTRRAVVWPMRVTGTDSAEMVSSAEAVRSSDAHSGAGALELHAPGCGGAHRAVLSARAVPGDATAYPALSFSVRAAGEGAPDALRFRVREGWHARVDHRGAGAEWQQYTLCLTPGDAMRARTLELSVVEAADCESGGVLFDDVRMIAAAMCVPGT